MGYTKRVFPLASPSVCCSRTGAHVLLVSKGLKNQGKKELSLVSFLSIRHWRGLCTITSHLNILKNTSWERGVLQTPACSVMHCWVLLLSSGCCLDSASRWALPPSSHTPPWQQSRLWQLQVPHPTFFLHYHFPEAVEGKARKVNSYSSPPKCRGGLANHKGLSPA